MNRQRDWVVDSALFRIAGRAAQRLDLRYKIPQPRVDVRFRSEAGERFVRQAIEAHNTIAKAVGDIKYRANGIWFCVRWEAHASPGKKTCRPVVEPEHIVEAIQEHRRVGFLMPENVFDRLFDPNECRIIPRQILENRCEPRGDHQDISIPQRQTQCRPQDEKHCVGRMGAPRFETGKVARRDCGTVSQFLLAQTARHSQRPEQRPRAFGSEHDRKFIMRNAFLA